MNGETCVVVDDVSPFGARGSHEWGNLCRWGRGTSDMSLANNRQTHLTM